MSGQSNGDALRTSYVVEVYVGRSRILLGKPLEDLAETTQFLTVLPVAKPDVHAIVADEELDSVGAFKMNF